MGKVNAVRELLKSDLSDLSDEHLNSLPDLTFLLSDESRLTFLTREFLDACLIKLPNYDCLRRGCWVQVGVWKGGGALFFKALMEDLKVNQPLYLLDTFSQTPVENIEHEKDVDFINFFDMRCKGNPLNYLPMVKELFRSSNLSDKVKYIVADVMHLNSVATPDNIAFLHVDVDFYEPTLQALRLFYKNVLPGGVIIIDDYFNKVLNCREAVDCFAEESGIDLNIHANRFSSFSLQITKPLNVL